MTLRRIPIRLSGNRDNLFMGGDRELIMFSGILAGTMFFADPGFKTFFLGGSLWFFALVVCRLMAKSDPKMRKIYLRHRKYKTYYPPRSKHDRENIETWKDF